MAKELFAAGWKNEFARQGISVAILHQGTVSDIGNSLGTRKEVENQGH